MAHDEAGRAMMAEGLARGLGLEGAADLAAQNLAFNAEVARTFEIPDLDLATPAQQGGAAIGEVAKLAIAGAGRVKGLTGTVRLADDLVPTARAELMTTTAMRGVTLGMDYMPEAIARFDFGAFLKERICPPPADLIDPHAHHVVLKRL